MLGKFVLVVLLSVCCASFFEQGLKKLAPFRGDVQRFAMKIPEEASNLETKLKGRSQNLMQKMQASLLLRGAPIGAFQPGQMQSLFGAKVTGANEPETKPLKLESFKIANCSASTADKDQFIIRRLQITPDPPTFPGKITFAFDLILLETLDNVTVDLVLEKKIGKTFIRIPCIGGLGSCPYDVCRMLATVSDCPEELKDHKIDCKCPFNKGTYDEPSISANIEAAVFAGGDYNATAKMYADGKMVGCYTATFSISYGV